MGETLIRAVDGVSLEIRAGEFVALLGSSGSGKSSVLNLIAGSIVRPREASSFRIAIWRNFRAKSLPKYRLHVVGMVFQSFNLIASMTLAENVELPLRFAEVDRSQRARSGARGSGTRGTCGHAWIIVPASFPAANSKGQRWRAL